MPNLGCELMRMGGRVCGEGEGEEYEDEEDEGFVSQ